MKLLVIQGRSMVPGITTEQLVERWHQLDKIEGLEVTVKTDLMDRSFKGYDAVLDDYDALIGIFITKDNLQNEIFRRHPNLKYVATTSHGFEEFDFEFTRNNGVTVTNTIYGDVTVAQFGMALLLELCHNTQLHADYVRNYDYSTGFCKVFSRQLELYEKTVGIIGLGSIGYWFARMAHGFGAKVISYSRHKKEGAKYDFIEQVSLDELLERSDVISLNCPLTTETRHIINKDTLAKMKDGVMLINTARGQLIDEEALLEALNSGKVYRAGLDVLTHEPPKPNDPLVLHPNCLVTAHIAWLSEESRFRTIDLACENFINYLNGNPTCVINGPKK